MSDKSDLGSDSPKSKSKYSPESIKGNSNGSQSIIWSEKSFLEIDMEYDERERIKKEKLAKEKLAKMGWPKPEHELARTPVKVLNQNGSELVGNMDTNQAKEIEGSSKLIEHEMTSSSQVVPEKVQVESELNVVSELMSVKKKNYPDQGNLNVQFEHKKSDNDELLPKKVGKAKGVKKQSRYRGA